MMAAKHDLVTDFINEHLQSIREVLIDKDTEIKEIHLVIWYFGVAEY